MEATPNDQKGTQKALFKSLRHTSCCTKYYMFFSHSLKLYSHVARAAGVQKVPRLHHCLSASGCITGAQNTWWSETLHEVHWDQCGPG